MKGLFYRIGFNTISQVTGKIISLSLSLITVGLLTRYLGKAGFGNYTLIFAYFAFFGTIADLGLQLTMVRELAKKTSLLKEMSGTYLWLKIFLTMASTILTIASLIFFPYSDFIKFGIIIASIGIAIGSLNNYGMVIFQAKLRLDLVTLVDVLTKLATTLFIYLFIVFNFGFYSILLTILIGNLAGAILIIFLLKKFIVLNFKFKYQLAKKLLIKSLSVFLISFLALLYFKVDTLILSFLKSADQVGIYGLAYKIIENILTLWGFYMASVYPLLAGLWYQKNNSKAYNVWIKSLFIAVASSGLIIILGLIFAPLLIQILGGREFKESILSFRILLFSTPFFFINNLFYHSFLAKEKLKLLLSAILSALILNITLNIIFIPRYGYLATSVITVLTEIFLTILYLIFVIMIKHRPVSYAKK